VGQGFVRFLVEERPFKAAKRKPITLVMLSGVRRSVATEDAVET
jgi:hypothetical protein